MIVAGDEADFAAERSPDRDGTQPDRAAADHGDALTGANRSPPERVHDHGEGFNEGRVADVDTSGQRHERTGGNPHLVGHPTVSADSEEHGPAGAAQVVIAVEARVTGAARGERLDGDRGVVVGEAGDLVAESDLGGLDHAGFDEVEIRPADPSRTNPHANAGAVGGRDVVDGDLAAVDTNSAHVSCRRARS